MNNRQDQRETLTENIVAQIKREIDGVLADSELSDEARETIKGDVANNTQRILDACSIHELQSELAFERYIESRVRDAEIQVRQLRRERVSQ